MLKSALPLLLLLPALELSAQSARNLIFFLGDGMGPTTVTAARIYQYGEAGKLNLEQLNRTARIKTYSNDAQTTDSAPSMAAYMTGVKMNNEVISMSADTQAKSPKSDGTSNCGQNNGQSVPTLFELAKASGKAIGAVTTTRVTHATPAATYAHVCHRDAENDIAAQLVPGGQGFNPALKTGLDLLLGGGRRQFLPTSAGGKREDGRDLVQELTAGGYRYVSDSAGLSQLSATDIKPVLGLFHLDHLDYELDRSKQALNQPSLAEMTEKAIEILSKKPEGYVLLVEGGRIDHALHGTNAKRVLEDTIAFDNAIKVALAKADLTNTLLVFTADHDHTMAFNGYAKKGNPILDVVRGLDGQPIRDAEGNSYTTLVFGNGPNRPDIRADLVSGSADKTQVLHDDYLQETGVRLASETHGGGDVMLGAKGPGSDGLKGTLDNTAVFSLLKQALGL